MEMEQIKGLVDCRTVIEADLGKPANHNPKYHMYKCPLHKEYKGYSFAVYREGWTCFGACNQSGDVFSYLKERHGLSLPEAARYLVETFHLPEYLLGSSRRPTALRPVFVQPEPPPQVKDEPPPGEWQQHARRLVKQAQQWLWGTGGERALHYLRTQRGFTRYMISNARLGYVPAESPAEYKYGRVLYPDWQVDGRVVRIPCGIVIPHFSDGSLWAVRVRRPPGVEGSKYMGVRGGRKALYWSDNLYPGMPVMMVEGEFDAICLDIAAFNLVCPVALASASNKHLNCRWTAKLMSAPSILIRMDADRAGQGAVAQLLSAFATARQVRIPDYKDVNDFMLGAGREAVRAWVQEVVSCLEQAS